MAHITCLALLWRHRAEDINMRSVWLCSRNDILADLSVLMAAAGVCLSRSQWPDVLIGLGIALFFFNSAIRIIHDGIRSYKQSSYFRKS
jgi:Co/Zn/Cd efflux system component